MAGQSESTSAQGVFAREKLNVHDKRKPKIERPVFFPHYSMGLELLNKGLSNFLIMPAIML
jgi:hypothetical protein